MGFRRASVRALEERGTASLELVAVVPVLIFGLFVAVQIAVVGHAFWSAGVAARAGARAAVVDRSASRAALDALPEGLRRGARVTDEDGVSVRVALPRLLPFIPDVPITASASLEEGR